MTYDAVHDEVVLFGGATGGPLGDTWTWDGTTFTAATDASSAPTPSRLVPKGSSAGVPARR
jgi:hypothetical protein